MKRALVLGALGAALQLHSSARERRRRARRGECLPDVEPAERARARGRQRPDRAARQAVRAEPAGRARQHERLPAHRKPRRRHRQLRRSRQRRERHLRRQRIARSVRRHRLPGSRDRAAVHRQLHRRRLHGRRALRLRHRRALPDRTPPTGSPPRSRRPAPTSQEATRQQQLRAAAAGAGHGRERQPGAGRHRDLRRSSRAPPARARASSAAAAERDHRLERPRDLAAARSPTAFPGRFSRDRLHRRASRAVATYALDNHAAATTLRARRSMHDPTATVDTRYPIALQARVVDAQRAADRRRDGHLRDRRRRQRRRRELPRRRERRRPRSPTPTGLHIAPALVADKTAGAFSATATAAGAQPLAFTLETSPPRRPRSRAGAASGAVDRGRHALPGPTRRHRHRQERQPGRGRHRRLQRSGQRARAAHFTASRQRSTSRAASCASRRTQTASRSRRRSPPTTPAGGYAVTATVTGSSRRTAFALINLPRDGARASIESPRLRLSDLARVASVGLRTRRDARSALGTRDRDRRRRDRRRARPLLLVAGGTARADRQARHQPAHRQNGQTLVRADRRAAARCARE